MTESDDEDVLEEEDQAVAEEEADALEVDGRPRHQLAGLMACRRSGTRADEPGVEAVAHVHLDAERLAPGDQAPPDHQRGLQHAEADDRPDVDPELLPSRAAAIALLITPPITQTSAICAACEPQASTIETTRETLYGFRKPSSRANVRR